MIVRLSGSGSSFKGLGAYLTHDPKAETEERVAWTHTLNLAQDHVPSAIDEMLWTARDAKLLKQEAGIRAGGRETENSVKHISLNWSPEDDPSREHMIAAAEEYLRHMKWHEHQAVLIAHDDKHYAHVHLMLNTVHPETGLCLNDDFERRRSQAWALGYERENGRIYCEERLKDARDREPSPPRNVWMAFQENVRTFDGVEKAQALHADKISGAEKDAGFSNADEWAKLKEFQRRERQEFFADGKAQFSTMRSEIYGEVRDEFRERWADFYAAKTSGVDREHLVGLKAQLVADQREALEGRRDDACAELRASRDELYRGMLDDQRQTRAELRGRQGEGWDNTAFFEALDARVVAFDQAAAFREAAREATAPEADRDRGASWAYTAEASGDEGESNAVPVGAAADVAGEVGFSLGLNALSLFDMLFREFEGDSAPARPRRSDAATNERLVADAATAQRANQEREAADDEWRRRNQEAVWRE